MGDNTAIEWTDATWNPVVGCSIVSPGCTNCYAMREAHRLGSNPKLAGKYAGLTRVVNGHPVWTGTVRLHDQALWQPLKWKRPRRIFVNSMSDLFHDGLLDHEIDCVFAIMALCPQHTFQVLTKRSARMRAYWNGPSGNVSPTGFRCPRLNHILNVADRMSRHDHPAAFEALAGNVATIAERGHFPNIWLGVSAEDQPRAVERIPDLLATPAAVRFVSAEPLLGAIDLAPALRCPDCKGRGFYLPYFSANHVVPCARCDQNAIAAGLVLSPGQHAKQGNTLDWVIVGGESGPHARPMHPDWIRSLRDQCVRAGVPFFFKQWGEWATGFTRISTGEPVFKRFETFQQWVDKAPTWVNGGICLDRNGLQLHIGADFRKARDEGRFPVTIMHRTGKSKAQAQLDGRTWREFPPCARTAGVSPAHDHEAGGTPAVQ